MIKVKLQDVFAFLKQADEACRGMGIEGIQEMLRRLKNPEETLQIVHVGGTNGKGSVCSYVGSVLADAGYRVGRYVSPTIRQYRERIQIVTGTEHGLETTYISEAALCLVMDRLKKIYDEMQREGCVLPSAFELETVAAFLYFAQEKCDIVVLEVGLGGRIDATNCIKKPICSVFTSISWDHMGILGNTLEEIAAEKAGILKENGIGVAYDYGAWAAKSGAPDVISPVLKKEAQHKNAELVFATFSQIKDRVYTLQETTFTYKEYERVKIRMLGENQVENAVLAMEVLEVLQKKGFAITRAHIYEGLYRTKWEGRFQIIRENPYYILDGAHNLDAAKSLKKNIERYFPEKKLAFVVGMLADKEYQKVMEILAEKAVKIVTVTPENERALPAACLAETAKPYCKNVSSIADIEQALHQIEQEQEQYDAIVVFGSLYSLGRVYHFFEPDTLQK